MIALGVSGFFNSARADVLPGLPRKFFHDAAAVIAEDGVVVSALEEERVNRVKHTNCFPVGAIRACLGSSGLSLADVDCIAFFFEEGFTDTELGLELVRDPGLELPSARELIAEVMGAEFQTPVDPGRVRFVTHHEAHAAAAFYHSGFDRALVVVLDGNGERDATTVYRGDAVRLEPLAAYPTSSSLGHLYTAGTRFLGFGDFDEYKVMGLAPSGDAATFEPLFASLYRLLPGGDYELDWSGFAQTFLRAGLRPRRSGERFEPEHRDFAAGLQRTLERLALHVVAHWRDETGERDLCLAGGVAHNCTMNSEIVAARLFDRVFVHPAAHDAGAALGAALVTSLEGRSDRPRERIRSVAWGPREEPVDEVRAVLDDWGDFVAYVRCDDIAGRAARLLADGKVVGWMQGRSEFGPRALGQRSILADPRPEENRTRINAVVKRRESFRPFAPAVIEEAAGDFFELAAPLVDLEFMVFVVPVRPEKRSLLGAVTHVDGTARVQVVARRDVPLFWSLIRAFGDLTDVPVVLNTSFNNYAEPIVHTGSDALRCFLTTQLDYAVIGDFLVEKLDGGSADLLKLRPRLTAETVLRRQVERERTTCTISLRHHETAEVEISGSVYEALTAARGRVRLRELLDPADAGPLDEIRSLWQSRLIDLVP
ncbi:MAG: hypothetical protein M3321_00490 [Actinomycetota bacterium]|nr:hypothetical protein [Actinomycetota bacterium]